MARMIDGDKLVENLRLIATCWSVSPFVSKEKHEGAADMLREVEREVKEAPTLTPPNEPLTIEQLREMDGEPVWFVDIKGRKWYPPGWAIVDRENCLVRLVKSWNPIFFEKYGEWWIAYRRPPEGGEINKITVVQHLGRLEDVALRPVSREQVEKVWSGCNFCNTADFGEFGFEITKHYAKICCALGSWRFPPNEQFLFCPKCGKPLTDEAVEIVMERMEALKDGDLEEMRYMW